MASSRFYIDTNVVIAIIEGSSGLTLVQRNLIAKIDAGAARAVTSELTLAECLVKPMRDKNAKALDGYLNFLDNRPNLPVLPITRDVLLEAARLRASLGAKLPDAIHMATALSSGCNKFLTNDLRLKLPASLEFTIWSELR